MSRVTLMEINCGSINEEYIGKSVRSFTAGAGT